MPELESDEMLATLRRAMNATRNPKPLVIPTADAWNAQAKPSEPHWTLIHDTEREDCVAFILMGNRLDSIDGDKPPIEFTILAGLNYLPCSHFEGEFPLNRKGRPSTLGVLVERGVLTCIPPKMKAPPQSRALLLKAAAYCTNPATLREILDTMIKAGHCASDSADADRIRARAKQFTKAAQREAGVPESA